MAGSKVRWASARSCRAWVSAVGRRSMVRSGAPAEGAVRMPWSARVWVRSRAVKRSSELASGAVTVAAAKEGGGVELAGGGDELWGAILREGGGRGEESQREEGAE